MPTQDLQVSPENVVALAVMFRDCVDVLEREAHQLEHELHVKFPWMDDPVSEWARDEFNRYFVYGERAFAKVILAEHERYSTVRDALIATAQHYGLTEELNAAGFTKLAQ